MNDRTRREGTDPAWLEGRLAELCGKWRVPGAAVAVVTPTDAVTVTFGFRDIAGARPVTRCTLFPIDSIGKTLTAALAAVESVGDVESRWDTPIADVLPWSTSAHPVAAASIRDVLCHRSGMPSYDYLWASGAVSDRDSLVDSHLPHLPPAAPVGARAEVSELMYIVAGSILERRTGMAWEVMLREFCRSVLGMEATGDETFAEPTEDLSHLYSWSREPGRWEERPQLRRAPVFASPAGTMAASIDGLAAIVRVHLTPGPLTASHLTELRRFGAAKLAFGSPGCIAWEGFTTGYETGQFRGRRLFSKSGAMATIAFLADRPLGVAVVCNTDSEPFLESAVCSVFDQALGMGRIEEIDAEYSRFDDLPHVERPPDRRTRETWLHGSFWHPGFGQVTFVDDDEGHTTLRYGSLNLPLRRTRTSRVYADMPGWPIPRVPIARAAVDDAVRIGFEPSAGALTFTRDRPSRSA
jgi:CubicO group peptidase (beta-lactamase class C family)